jgi:hypothetical protein
MYYKTFLIHLVIRHAIQILALLTMYNSFISATLEAGLSLLVMNRLARYADVVAIIRSSRPFVIGKRETF